MTPHTPHSIQNSACYTFISFQQPVLWQTYPMLDLPYAALHQTCPMPVTYPMPPYTGPALHRPTLDLPYAGNLPYAALC